MADIFKGTVSIDEIERRHTGHFFDANAKRFFRSRMPQTGYRVGNKAWFITSEQFADFHGYVAARKYTVRVIDWDTGRLLDNVGEFNTMTKSEAQTAMKHAIAEAVKMAEFVRDEIAL